MYKENKRRNCKYILGQTIKYKNENHKIIGIRFTCDGVLYKLSEIREWIKEGEI